MSTPFPTSKVLVIGCVQLCNTFSYLSTYPFVGFMLMSFWPGLQKEEVGYYSGLLEGTYHLGAIIGALAWGRFADVFGRKPATLFGLVGTIISAILFGCSKTFGMACFARFAWGFLNQNIGVCKTMLSEVTTDEHTAKAMSVVGLNNGIGRVLGPALGGLLSEPAMKYPAIFGGIWLFNEFPFLLPCLICAVGVAVTLLAAYFVLEETLDIAKREQMAIEAKETAAKLSSEEAPPSEQTSAESDDQEEQVALILPASQSTVNDRALCRETSSSTTDSPSGIRRTSSRQSAASIRARADSISAAGAADQQPAEIMLTPHIAALTSLTENSEQDAELDDFALDDSNERDQRAANSSADDASSVKGQQPQLSRGRDPAPKQGILKIEKTGNAAVESSRPRRGCCSNWRRLLSDRAVLVSISLYCALGFTALVSNELFPLYALLPPSHGGFGWSSTEIGLTSAFAGPPLIVYQLIIYDKIAKRYGVVTVARWALALTTFFMATTPLLSLLLRFSSTVQTALISIHIALTALVRITSFSCIFVFVANSALPLERGVVNGLSQSLVSVSRFAGPTLFTPLFAWSVEGERPYPLNHFLSWHLIAIMTAVTLWLTFALPPWIERKRTKLQA